MKKEIQIFFTALMFYTRIPCPKWVNHDPEYLNKSTKYISVIGCLIGLLSAGVMVSSMRLIHPITAVLLAIVTSVFITGSFHEDGFADVCDGFGGGWTKMKILNIMKDSSVGTYGVVGLVLLLGIKVSVLYEIITQNRTWWVLALILITGHSISRLTAATTIFTHEYVREDDQSKVKPVAKKLGVGALLFMTLIGLIPLIILSHQTHWLLFITIMPVYLTKVFIQRFFSKWIGGYTGDCLGAIQQVSEVVFYLSFLLIVNCLNGL